MVILLVRDFNIHNVGLRFSGTSDTHELVFLSDEDAIVWILLIAELTGNRLRIETMLDTLSVHYNGILSFGVVLTLLILIVIYKLFLELT